MPAMPHRNLVASLLILALLAGHAVDRARDAHAAPAGQAGPGASSARGASDEPTHPAVPGASLGPREPLAWFAPIEGLPIPGADGQDETEPDGADQSGWLGITLEGASCGRGAPFRYYLNRSADPEAGLIIWLSGGGVCVKDGPPPEGAAGPARELHCMTFSNFTDGFLNDRTVDLLAVAPYFDRTNAASPFRAWHYAVIPYCTGDVHAGRMSEPYDYDPSPEAEFLVTHRGHLNVVAVLDDLVARLPNRDAPVLLTGVSAGGFGAIFNYPEAVARWPNTALIPDAGIAPMHPGSLLVRAGPAIAARWDAWALMPPYCQEPRCVQDTLYLLAAHAGHHDGTTAPWRPFGYLQGQQDRTLAAFLEVTACGYQVGLRGGLRDGQPNANLRAWVPATDQHVFGLTRDATTQSGIGWAGWFAELATAANADELPADAVDAWLPCPTIGLPFLSLQR